MILFYKKFKFKVFDLHELNKLISKYGLAAEFDLNGKILKSWHDPSGKKVECVTSMAVHGEKLFLGSFYNDFIVVLDY